MSQAKRPLQTGAGVQADEAILLAMQTRDPNRRAVALFTVRQLIRDLDAAAASGLKFQRIVEENGIPELFKTLEENGINVIKLDGAPEVTVDDLLDLEEAA